MTFRTRYWLGAALVLSLLLGWGGPALAQQLGGDFTASEERKLGRGKLITRKTEEQRGKMRLIGGMSWQVVDAPVDFVERFLDDVSRYEQMLPGVAEFEEIPSDGSFPLIRICHKKSRVKGCYHVNLRLANDGRDVFFQLAPGRDNDLRAGWGFLRVTEYGEGKTLVAWGVMADVGKGVIAGLMRPHVRRWMLKVPTTMKKYVEARHDET